MPDRPLLLAGILAATILLATPIALGAMLPGYHAVHQTISEIGERGSPFRVAFSLWQLAAAVAMLIFAVGVIRLSLATKRSLLPALLLGMYGLAVIGIALFEAPHPLHNIFGISTGLGFLTPLAVALLWRNASDLGVLKALSAFIGTVLLIGMAFNVSPLFMHFEPNDFVRANYGLIQRSVLFPFYIWCGLFSAALLRSSAGERSRPTT